MRTNPVSSHDLNGAICVISAHYYFPHGNFFANGNRRANSMARMSKRWGVGVLIIANIFITWNHPTNIVSRFYLCIV